MPDNEVRESDSPDIVYGPDGSVTIHAAIAVGVGGGETTTTTKEN